MSEAGNLLRAVVGGELSVRTLDRDDALRFAPIRVPPGDHNVEDPLPALFFRLHQAESLHVVEVVLHPANLLLGHATALQVNGEPSEMRRGSIPVGRRSVPVVTAKTLLDFNRAHGGVHLNLLMKALVIGLAEILNKVASPWPAEAARRIESRIEAQGFAGSNRQ